HPHQEAHGVFVFRPLGQDIDDGVHQRRKQNEKKGDAHGRRPSRACGLHRLTALNRPSIGCDTIAIWMVRDGFVAPQVLGRWRTKRRRNWPISVLKSVGINRRSSLAAARTRESSVML